MKNKKHIVITVIIGFAIFIFGFSLGSTQTSNNNVTSTSVPVAPTAESVPVKSKEPVVKAFYAINESATFNDATVIVTKVVKSKGGEYDVPKTGMEFVTVTVTIKNAGDGQISYNPYDFKMQNSKGQITDGTYTSTSTNTALNSGDLAKGGSITGTMVYEQPKNDTALTLKYTGNMFSNDGVNFKLN